MPATGFLTGVSSFPGNEDGKVLDRETLARGGGILGNSPCKVADPGALELEVLLSREWLPPRRFAISFVGEGGRNPRGVLNCPIRWPARYLIIAKLE